MAEVVKCEKNHYYDGALFATCPHCKAGTEMLRNTAVSQKNIAQYALEYIRSQKNIASSSAEKSKEKDTFPEMKKIEAAEEKTVGFSVNVKDDYFVTGWLVCVEGPELGHTFNLHYGYNTLGYSRRNQISIMEDEKIARKVHCSIIYEDKKNRFFLVPEGDNVTFLNGKQMENSMLIKSGDIIEAGNSTFEFIAFCRDERKWERKDTHSRKPF